MDAREITWLRRTRDLSQRLGSEADPSRLAPLILDAALELTEAERAFLIRVSGPDMQGNYRLEVLATRGFVGDALAGPQGEVPRSVVERTLSEGGRAVISSRPADASLLWTTSVAGRGILSLVCVPLRLRGQLRGVLYLDHRGQEALFRESDLPTLQTFATQAALSLELAGTQEAAPPPARFLVGSSPAASSLLEEVQRVALTTDPVLVCGEPGTEGALVAREIHAASAQRETPFRSLRCADSPEEVAQSLLGTSERPGWLSRERTICLEEVEALAPDLQRLLARAVGEGSFTPLGSTSVLPVRARVVALTEVDLAESAHRGTFRGDLYYRLDVQRLVVPPLRQRREDLPALCAAIAARLGHEGLNIGEEAMKRLQQYAWPGNVLELEAEVGRLVRIGTPRVAFLDLSDRVREGRGVVHERQDFTGRTLGELEEELVRATMEECQGVKSRAARQLGIPRSTLYHLLDRYGLR